MNAMLQAAMSHFELYWLVLGRTGGVLFLAPVFSSSQIPTTVRAAVAAIVALAVLPAVPVPPGGLPGTLLPFIGLLVQEVVTGVAIGYLTSLMLMAAEVAGALIDINIGFSMASVLDPNFGSVTSISGSLMTWLVLMVFLLENGHLVLLAALVESFRRLPIGSPLPGLGARAILHAFAAAFLTAVQIAAPVLAAVFLVTVALALVGRATPQLNLLVGGLPVQVLAGIAAMMVALPVTLSLMSALAPASEHAIAALLGVG